MTANGAKTPVPAIRTSVSDLVSADGRYQIRRDATWLYADLRGRILPDHGWKFHVSSRLADFRDLVAVLVPFLLDHGCTFKLARSVRVLGELNDGSSAPPSVGKAVTIYPDADQVPRLGAGLVELLRGRVGPRILSDRRLAPDAPVYYRYGPFRSNLVANRLGNLTSVLVGPSGETFDGWATTDYRQPHWVTDPFLPSVGPGEAAITATKQPSRLGNHYAPQRGLAESARGNVYTATDVRTGELVVVKQARAYVAESLDGHDARTQLRNERYVLEALRDIPGVARFLDHFQHGEDEYLVTSYDGKFTLSADVTRKGRYVPNDERHSGPHPTGLGESRSLDALAHRLARTLREIHARGYLLRDLSPKNLVVGPAGDVTFIDFGHCHHHDVVIRGGTKGYAPARQFADEPAEPRDDLHALGMTLFAAAIGAEPLVDEDDPDAARMMALRVLDRMYSDRPPPVIAAVIDLLSADAQAMTSAFSGLAEWRLSAQAPRARRVRATAHRRGPGTEALVDRVTTQLVSRADQMLDNLSEPDPGVYRGTAGIGSCLLPHRDRADVAATVERLAAFTSRAADRLKLRPGLYLGTTGVELFLRRAEAAGVPVKPLSDGRLFGEPGDTVDGDDIMNGAAGVGLGHLLLNELDPRPQHEDTVRRCLEALGEHDGAAWYVPNGDASKPGRDTTVGVSHGHAGVIEFLRHRYRLAPSAESRGRLTVPLAALVDQVSGFVAASAEPGAVPLCTSWCRGMAGMGRVLYAAGRQLGESSLVDLAVTCADGCLRRLPQLATAGQCCGVAGVGELLCDLVGHDDRFLAAAESAATQLLLLNADAAPIPPTRNGVQPGGMSWASGAAGVLGFLTRLRDLTPGGVATGPF